AIDEAYATMDDFALLEELEKISQVSMPVAIQEIRNAKILHTQECEVDQMEETVKEILHLEK
ncbi:MAG: threonine synthase, partial [Lachnospiraceae bacterium]